MKGKNKQIEEMANELHPHAMFGNIEIYDACDTLYNIGYRKASDVATEIYLQLMRHGATYVRMWIKERYEVEIEE